MRWSWKNKFIKYILYKFYVEYFTLRKPFPSSIELNERMYNTCNILLSYHSRYLSIVNSVT